MGRFASTVEFYERCREPYSPEFFRAVAQQLCFSQNDDLLDIGCGPGLLTLGFSPYVGRSVGVDPELAMLQAARENTRSTENVQFLQSRLEDFGVDQRFRVITIGRALHWLDREAALPKLDQLLAANGLILICRAASASDSGPWLGNFNAVRKRWVTQDETRYRGDGTDWFAGSDFSHQATIETEAWRTVTSAELIGRALSRSNTSPEVLGASRSAFETELLATLQPFEAEGPLRERIVASASVFRRHIEV